MKGWSEVPRDLVAVEAMAHCIKNQILTADDKIQVYTLTYGPDGESYGGYDRVSLDEVIRRKAIVGFFEGFQVLWTDVILHPYPRGKEPIDTLNAEQLVKVQKRFAYRRVYSGTLDEVTAYCS